MAEKPNLAELGFDHFGFELIVTTRGFKVATSPMQMDPVASEILKFLHAGPDLNCNRIYARSTFDGFVEHAGLPEKTTNELIGLVTEQAQELHSAIENAWAERTILVMARTLLARKIEDATLLDLKGPEEINLYCPCCSHPLIDLLSQMVDPNYQEKMMGAPCFLPENVREALNTYIQAAVFEKMIEIIPECRKGLVEKQQRLADYRDTFEEFARRHNKL